jgi:hypothetical protein
MFTTRENAEGDEQTELELIELELMLELEIEFTEIHMALEMIELERLENELTRIKIDEPALLEAIDTENTIKGNTAALRKKYDQFFQTSEKKAADFDSRNKDESDTERSLFYALKIAEITKNYPKLLALLEHIKILSPECNKIAQEMELTIKALARVKNLTDLPWVRPFKPDDQMN